jgi:hypothetical protein
VLVALRGPLGDLSDRRSAAACCRLNCRPRQAGAQHSGNAGVAVFVFWPAAIGAGRFGLDDALRLAPTAVVIVLARDSGEHVEHHGVERGEHARRELVAWGGKLPARRLTDTDWRKLRAELDARQVRVVALDLPRQAVDLLDQQHVARLGVRQQAEELRPSQLRARLVLGINQMRTERPAGELCRRSFPGSDGRRTAFARARVPSARTVRD